MSKPKRDRTVNIPDEVMVKLLTDSEIRMVKQRYLILNLLQEGNTIRSIAEEVGVGTDTVVRTARLAEKQNLKKVLKSDRRRKIKSKTPWIFGKSGLK